MKKIEEQYGYYTINDTGKFHSFDEEPAIVVYDHITKDMQGNITEVSGYRAWYNNGLCVRSERNTGEIYTINENGNLELNQQ